MKDNFPLVAVHFVHYGSCACTELNDVIWLAYACIVLKNHEATSARHGKCTFVDFCGMFSRVHTKTLDLITKKAFQVILMLIGHKCFLIIDFFLEIRGQNKVALALEKSVYVVYYRVSLLSMLCLWDKTPIT